MSFNENYSAAGIFQAENPSIDNVPSSIGEDEGLNPQLEVSTCQKVCNIGKACGNSCISRSKICHKSPGTACDSR